MKEALLGWYLLRGSRFTIIVSAAVGIFLLNFWLLWSGLLNFRNPSMMGYLVGGAISGLFALLSISISITQLLLARISGSPGDLTDRLEGSLQFRDSVVTIIADRSAPIDPVDFLSTIAKALSHHVAELENTNARELSTESHHAIENSVAEIGAYAERMDDGLEAGKRGTFDALSSVLDSEYATHLITIGVVREEHGDDISAETDAQLESIMDLLKAIAVARQYFKSIFVQQQLAQMSRRLVHFGLLSLLSSFYLLLVYVSGDTFTVPEAYLPVLASATLTVIVVPVLIIAAYAIQIATIGRYTVSVGPFVPPEQPL